MNSFRPNPANRQAYIQKVLKSQQPRAGVVFGAGRILQEGSGVGADLLRQSLMVLGVAGLVGLAIGATTDCAIYWRALNWISSFFY